MHVVLKYTHLDIEGKRNDWAAKYGIGGKYLVLI